MIYDAYLPFIPVQGYFFARFIFGTLYNVYAFIIVLKAINEGKSKVFKELIVWLNIVIGLGFLANLFGVLFTVQNLLKNNYILILEGHGTGRVLFVIFSSVLIVSIYFFPKILYGLNTSTGAVTLASVYELNETNSRISKSVDISEQRLVEIDRLIGAYVPRKNYLIPSFSISDLVKDLDVPLHVLSIYFNSHKGVTFTSWKNQLRIKEAIQLMQSGKADAHTLESIGEACGYKSRSNFIQAFKAQTGESPSAYLKKLS
jgi:AraC-like DNA-binding protein